MTHPYVPRPLVTDDLQLPKNLEGLLERLAEHNHDVWARQRIRDGWSWGPERNDGLKHHPCLVPYGELPESEKEYDRCTARQVLLGTIYLGYRIEGSD